MIRVFLGLFLVLFLFFSCKEEKIDTVENNTNEVKDEAVAGFDFKDVNGIFEGDYEGKKATLDLGKDSNYSLKYDGKSFAGKYYYQGDGSTIELEYMEYQTSLPFYLLKIEDPSYLTIIKDDVLTDYYLEKPAK